MSLVVAAVVLICPTFLNRYSLGVVNTALIYGMAGWGISVLLGMGGQLSFASISFMGIGGYAVANFCTGRLPFTRRLWPPCLHPWWYAVFLPGYLA